MYSDSVTEQDLRIVEMRKRVPDVTIDELRVGPEVVDCLPCEVPWLTGLGVGLICITDIRRGENGKIEFQLADEFHVPYSNGTEWRTADCESFWNEWPQ